MKKIIIALTILLLIACAKEQPVFETPDPGVHTHSYTGLEIAEKVETFMSKMEIENSYYWKETCTGEKQEPIQPQHNYWALMAYSGLYDASQKYVEKLNKNVDFIKTDDSDSELWNSFQMYQYYILSDKYPTLIPEHVKDGFRNTISYVGDNLNTIYQPENDNSMIIAVASRASFLSAELLKTSLSSTVLENANHLQELAEQRSKKENILLVKDDVLYEASCWVQLAKLQKGETNEVQEFFDNINLRGEFAGSELLEKSIPMNLLPCAESLLILSEKTGNEEYLTHARRIIGGYLAYNWDTPDNKICNGDYGLISRNLYTKDKIFTENTYFVYLLTREGIKDHKFMWTD